MNARERRFSVESFGAWMFVSGALTGFILGVVIEQWFW